MKLQGMCSAKTGDAIKFTYFQYLKLEQDKALREFLMELFDMENYGVTRIWEFECSANENVATVNEVVKFPLNNSMFSVDLRLKKIDSYIKENFPQAQSLGICDVWLDSKGLHVTSFDLDKSLM